MPRRRPSLPLPDVTIRNRPRQLAAGVLLALAVAVTVWTVATSPLDGGDVALWVLVYLPVLLLLCRLAAQRVVADPSAGEILVCNELRSHRLAWTEIDTFELTDGVFLLAPSQHVTCVAKSGDRIRVRAAGRWVRAAGGYGASITSKQTLGLIAKELNVRRHQHEHGLALDELP